MGRVKIEMKKIENKDQRNIAFAKRKCGLIKKAYELSVLCGVQIALILFSPSGKLFFFESKTRLEETIHQYIDLPCYKRAPIPDEPYIRRWINDMRLESKPYSDTIFREIFDDEVSYHLQPKDIEDEIDECKAKLAAVEQELGCYLKNPNDCESIDEIEHQEKLLEEALKQVQARKQLMEVESNLFDELPNHLFQTNMELEISSME